MNTDKLHVDDGAPTCEWRDTAWAFALGSAAEDESAEFVAHLTEGCAACGAELAQARGVIADLDVAVAERTVARGHGALPNPAVRRELLDGINRRAKTVFGSHRAENSLADTAIEGVTVAARSDDGWKPTAIDGVEFKTLVEDTDRRMATALVRMAPGTSYPAHRHAAREECFVLSGDLSFAGTRMTTGDYQVAEKDSVHPVQATENGCVLLIVSSLDDEPIDG